MPVYNNEFIKPLLADAISSRLNTEYGTLGASPAKRHYYEGRIAALLACLVEDTNYVLCKLIDRYNTERHAPGDDITWPEGTNVHWLRGCIQATQDLIRHDNRPQGYDHPLEMVQSQRLSKD